MSPNATREKSRIPRVLDWALVALALSLLSGSTPRRVSGNSSPDAVRPTSCSPEMRREIQQWFVAHPAHGASVIATTAVDTFLVGNFFFDTDGNTGTQIDTARITVGQAVLFKWAAGFHTTTSGNPGDLNAGSRWDAPIDNLAPQNLEFAVQFDTAGTYPFFCRPHGQFFSMKGVVIVAPNVGAPSIGVPAVSFVGAPWPNPTRAGASMRFALPRPSHVRIDVFDASGRSIESLLEADLAAGTHAVQWSGRARGRPVAAGVYHVRVRTDAGTAVRRVVVER